ncbi:MAG: dephospho-CoA kinase [Planctomycetaceae bacterium]|nr:dephospho-CoA kinase [Planctomycetaceae bacterium]
MKVIGLVGGIGGGKSTVAKIFASRDGVVAIDADRLGHDVLRLDEVKKQVRSLWGNLPFDEKGEIDRRKMAGIVFAGTAESDENLKKLTGISHPKIAELLQKQLENAKISGKWLVLIDAPLLFEGKWDRFCDEIIFVDAPEELRIQRMLSRGWTPGEYRARVANQCSLEEKKRAAKYVLQNDGTISQLEEKIEKLIREILLFTTKDTKNHEDDDV